MPGASGDAAGASANPAQAHSPPPPLYSTHYTDHSLYDDGGFAKESSCSPSPVTCSHAVLRILWIIAVRDYEGTCAQLHLVCASGHRTCDYIESCQDMFTAAF